MHRIWAKAMVFAFAAVMSTSCSQDVLVAPDVASENWDSNSVKMTYAVTPGFVEASRFTHRGSKHTSGACLFAHSERLVHGQRSSLRIVGLDLEKCEFVVAKGHRGASTEEWRGDNVASKTESLRNIPSSFTKSGGEWAFLTQCGDPGADPSCDPGGGGGGSECSATPCAIGGTTMAGTSFQDVYALDPVGAQVNQDINRVRFTFERNCITQATLSHGYYYFGGTGWYSRYFDGYKYPTSCGSAGGETLAGYSNDAFCRAINLGFAGPTYTDYQLNRVIVTPFGYTDFYIAAYISGACANMLRFGLDRVS